MRINVDISPGELVDKLTILIIKLNNITDEDKLYHIKNEYAALKESYNNIQKSINIDQLQALEYYTEELIRVNEELWNILQKQRDLEKAQNLGREFVEISLKVYHMNDGRAFCKRKINEMFGTDIAEVKMYK